MSDAIKIIQREHRAIASVIHALDHVLDEVRDKKLAPDFELFEAILDYIRDFPDHFHHPKEDDYLFAALLKRDPSIRETIDKLEHEHKEGYRVLADLRWKLDDWKKDPDGGMAPFYDAAKQYVELERKHMGLEEQKVIPAARKALTENDWREIDAAFGQNDDPIFGDRPRADFDKLFARIVNLAPAPYGLGERKPPPPPEAPKEEHVRYRQDLINLHWI